LGLAFPRTRSQACIDSFCGVARVRDDVQEGLVQKHAAWDLGKFSWGRQAPSLAWSAGDALVGVN
jgi:hypothetical protein